jgi:hypothetical protein
MGPPDLSSRIDVLLLRVGLSSFVLAPSLKASNDSPLKPGVGA